MLTKFWWDLVRIIGRSVGLTRRSSLSLRFGGHGFRDLHLFKISLLAKQCWRVLNDEGSLLYKTLCAYIGYGP